ncbi:MAG: DNA replication/repair protein RecF [bacterium]|nr:DNA replication/repair protein RecF [bacterium]
MIKELRLKRFRNYSEEKICFNEGINVFLGRNGHGKTNLLEAVYFLGMLSSFRKADLSRMAKEGESTFSIEGFFLDDDASSLYLEKGKAGWSRLSADGIDYRKKTDYIGRIKMVVFSPDEMELIQGSPDIRRRYIDRTCFNVSRRHLKRLNAYKRLLKQRNLLLKRGRFSDDELDVWTEKLAEAGAGVIEGRRAILNMLNDRLKISHPFAGSDSVLLNYLGDIEPDEDLKKNEKKLFARLLTLRREERLRRMTLAGPHRDDVEILVNGSTVKGFSSRGEMRSVLLALKAAEVEIYKDSGGKKPLILLDDVASELDIDRRGLLLDYLRSKGEQVLITTTEAENLPLTASEKESIFKVEDGKIIH